MTAVMPTNMYGPNDNYHDQNNHVSAALIKKLVLKINKMIKFKRKIVFNSKFLNGTPRKILDSTKIYKIEWKPKVNLDKGIAQTIQSFLHENFNNYTSK